MLDAVQPRRNREPFNGNFRAWFLLDVVTTRLGHFFRTAAGPHAAMHVSAELPLRRQCCSLHTAQSTRTHRDMIQTTM
jgi:hypothetical protein